MFAFSDEQQMVRQMVRRWVEAKLVPANADLERHKVLPYDLMRDFAKSFGLAEMVRAKFERMAERSAKAEERGDDGGGHMAGDPALQAIMSIEMCRVSPGFFLSFGASLGLAGGAIMAKGTLEQKKRWALPILTTEKIGAWGMTEPGAGSDAFGSMRTVARPDGDFYVLNGQKTFITNAPHADTCVVYAKIDRGQDVPMAARPVHAFIVEKGTPGFTQSRPMEKMGMLASPTGELFLEDVRVHKSHLLGETEQEAARDKARDVFHGERTSMAPMAFGIIDKCIEVATKHSQERVTWGKPIGEYQLVQEKLARMFVHRQNVENLLFKQLWLQKNRKNMNAAEASATKLYCARAATECALEAVQILGGNGYMREYHVEQLARDAKLLQIGGGTDEIQIGHIARFLLKAC
ncbi:MAG: acyl-CoA dehydrogenase family protein [Deltaproteobacteria bacterium]|nr:acyl-CoA dehydrogenase family protein [Deltaproteobacteria bacterium]